jgi:hypothetical protein
MTERERLMAQDRGAAPPSPPSPGRIPPTAALPERNCLLDALGITITFGEDGVVWFRDQQTRTWLCPIRDNPFEHTHLYDQGASDAAPHQ